FSHITERECVCVCVCVCVWVCVCKEELPCLSAIQTSTECLVSLSHSLCPLSLCPSLSNSPTLPIPLFRSVPLFVSLCLFFFLSLIRCCSIHFSYLLPPSFSLSSLSSPSLFLSLSLSLS